MSESKGDEGQDQKAPLLEWFLAVIGVVVVVGIVAYLVFVGVSTGSGPPDLHARPIRSVEQNGSHLMIVEVENLGGSPAASVLVEGRLFDEGTNIQTSEVTIDYVPVDSTGDAALVFTEPPEEFELRLRVLGYLTP